MLTDIHLSCVNRETFLKYQGDIVSPKDMHTALIKYPVTNTTYILANTTHAPFKRKFDVPKLSVRSVHEYAYGVDGNVELYHHTSLKKVGTHEKLWFHPPPRLASNATVSEATIHKAATTGHEKIKAWSAAIPPFPSFPPHIHKCLTAFLLSFTLKGLIRHPPQLNTRPFPKKASGSQTMTCRRTRPPWNRRRS